MLAKVPIVLATTFYSSLVVGRNADQMSLSAVVTESVPGVNNATFTTVARSEQLFSIEFFDIAPLPIPVCVLIYSNVV